MICAGLLVAVSAFNIQAQTTAFSYQGSLKTSGTPANGLFDFEFALFDSQSAGSQIGSTVSLIGVNVTGGIFTVMLDFGNQFSGANRFLEIRVRPNSGGSFTTLAPRQQLVSTPYSIKSFAADTATNATNATTATNAISLGGITAGQYVLTGDTRLSDQRAPTSGSSNYIQNTFVQQPTSNFYVSGIGRADIFEAATQFNIAGHRMLTSTGGGPQPFNNLFAGESAGTFTTTGTNNSFFGWNSGKDNVSGTDNSFYGYSAGIANQDGSSNTMFGSRAGRFNIGGGNNSFFGALAGQTNQTGSLNTGVGYLADLSAANLTNATAIGSRALVAQSNSIVLGSIQNINGASADTNVGVGTTMPIYRLHVVQNTANTYASHIQTNGLGAGTSFGLVVSAGTNANDASINARNQAGNSTLLVRGDGLVGIGTTNPLGLLHISSNNTASTALVVENIFNAQSRQLIISNYGSVGGGLYWTGLDSANTSSLLGPNLFVLRSTGGIAFSGTNAAEHMRLSTNGNLGVGTSSPGYRLEVNQTASDTFATHIKTTGVASGSSYGLVVSAGTNSGDSAAQFRNQAGDPIMRVRGDLTVGIGTTDPKATLEVHGRTDSTESAFAVYDRSGALLISAGGFGIGLNQTVFVSLTGGAPVHQVCIDNAFALTFCSSSLRYKEHIKRFDVGLNTISRLKPITFDWKQGGSHDLGLAAEDVEKIEPLLVTYNKEGRVEGVKYDRVGVVLINAVKEQQEQIEQLKNQIDRQQEQINRQENRAQREHARMAAQQQQLEALKSLICRSHSRKRACQ